jgi:hypothetical protein
MKKIILSVGALMALGIEKQPTDGVDVESVEAKIIELSGKVKTLTEKNTALELAATAAKEAQETARKESITKKVDLGIAQGKFPATKKQEMIDLGLASETALDTVLGSIAAKVNFSADITNPGTTEVKTMEDFQKLGLAEQLDFKNNNPEEYKKILG